MFFIISFTFPDSVSKNRQVFQYSSWSGVIYMYCASHQVTSGVIGIPIFALESKYLGFTIAKNGIID